MSAWLPRRACCRCRCSSSWRGSAPDCRSLPRIVVPGADAYSFGMTFGMRFSPTRRSLLAFGASLLLSSSTQARGGFEQWVQDFRARALTRVSATTYDRAMRDVKPDRGVLQAVNEQPEFNEDLWQYLNRRCSDWRVITGKERAKEYASLLQRVEAEYGV